MEVFIIQHEVALHNTSLHSTDRQDFSTIFLPLFVGVLKLGLIFIESVEDVVIVVYCPVFELLFIVVL